MTNNIEGMISIVTVGNRVFIGKLNGGAGRESILEGPLVLVELVQMDRTTQQPVGVAIDLRKPCMALDIPESILIVPETIQVLSDINSKDKMLAENYKMALSRYSAESAGILAPDPSAIRRINNRG